MSTPTAIYLNIGPYLEVISGISTVFSFSDGVVKLTGPLGAGKTSLLKELAKELRNRYPDRIIIYDLPPILLSDDCLAFMRHLDAFLFVVNEGKTSQADIDRALSLTDPSKFIGTVLNGARHNFEKPKYYDANR